jgi:hypothetical protein
MPAKGKGVIKPLEPDDPRNPDHPSHAKRWLELAGALGRLMADMEYDRRHKGEHHDDQQDRRSLRKIFE